VKHHAAGTQKFVMLIRTLNFNTRYLTEPLQPSCFRGAELHNPDTCPLTVVIEAYSPLPFPTAQQRRSRYKHYSPFLSITSHKRILGDRNRNKIEKEEKYFFPHLNSEQEIKSCKRKLKHQSDITSSGEDNNDKREQN
jgi:hypothetical protein